MSFESMENMSFGMMIDCANLIPNALCLCGKSDETAKHCLLHCKIILYQEIHFLLEFKELIMIY
jgi:hypothetical protein